MKMQQCPRFEECHASLCPLDTHVLQSKYLDGEAICFYIREYEKGNSDNSLVFTIIEEKIDEIKVVGGNRFIKQLEKAKNSASKTETQNLVSVHPENTPESKNNGEPTEVECFKSCLYLYEHQLQSVEPLLFTQSKNGISSTKMQHLGCH